MRDTVAQPARRTFVQRGLLAIGGLLGLAAANPAPLASATPARPSVGGVPDQPPGVGLAPPAQSARDIDAFMWFESGEVPIEGETTDKQYSANKAFEISLFDLTVSNPTSIGSASGGAGTGKAELKPLTITKAIDKASPALFKLCATGSHASKAYVALRKGGASGTSIVFGRYVFNLVFVNEIEWVLKGDSFVEQVKLAYGAVTVEYTPRLPDGTAGKTSSQTWNQVTNTDSPTVPGP